MTKPPFVYYESDACKDAEHVPESDTGDKDVFELIVESRNEKKTGRGQQQVASDKEDSEEEVEEKGHQVAENSFVYYARIIRETDYLPIDKVTNPEVWDAAKELYNNSNNETTTRFLRLIVKIVMKSAIRCLKKHPIAALTADDLFDEFIIYICTKQLKYIAYPNEPKRHYPIYRLHEFMKQRFGRIIEGLIKGLEEDIVDWSADVSHITHGNPRNVDRESGLRDNSPNPTDYGTEVYTLQVDVHEDPIEHLEKEIEDELLAEADKELRRIVFLRRRKASFRDIAKTVRPSDYLSDPENTIQSVKSRYHYFRSKVKAEFKRRAGIEQDE